jgi:lipopolysaccharide export system protein LptA
MSFPMKKETGYIGLFILSFILLLSTDGFAQKRLRFKADKQIGQRQDGVRIDYLIGDVVIRQDETTIYADSALVRKKDRAAEAFGNVRVTEGDSIDIRSKRLIYDGVTGTAGLREDVVYRDGQTMLFTDHLDYNKFDGTAHYFNGGRMVDGENTLESRTGTFDKQNQTSRFYGEVVLRTPDGVINSDTLIYNTETKVAIFKGPTKVVRADGSVTDAEDGLVYDTRSESTTVMKGEMENEDYVITGNKLNYDQLNDVFTAIGDVVMTSKDEEVVITGGRSVYDRKTGYTYVTGNPVMRRPVQGDTLYLSADTLVAIETELDVDKRLLAYKSVQIYKNDLQGVADSLAYFFADSTIFFYQDPVLWNEESQLIGDTISVVMKNNQIDQLLLHTNAFVISQDTVRNFNQVKGRQIRALFNEGDLHRINVDGNGESIYFVLDEKELFLVGMNRMTCGNMQMNFKDRQIDHINFYQKPEGKFIPPHELEEPDKRLSGFNWRGEERPSKAGVLRKELLSDKEAQEPVQSPGNLSPLPEGKVVLPVEEKPGNSL